MEELVVEVEAVADVAEALADAFSERLAVRIPTKVVPADSLPRFELKARRVVDER
jgi:phenylacetate-CoA ligase